jgi:hypothetical protein
MDTGAAPGTDIEVEPCIGAARCIAAAGSSPDDMSADTGADIGAGAEAAVSAADRADCVALKPLRPRFGRGGLRGLDGVHPVPGTFCCDCGKSAAAVVRHSPEFATSQRGCLDRRGNRCRQGLSLLHREGDDELDRLRPVLQPMRDFRRGHPEEAGLDRLRRLNP